MSNSNLAVIIPTLNEEEGIVPTIMEIKQTIADARIIVVDGSSTDKTVELAKDFGVEIIAQKGKGKGCAISQSLSRITHETDYVAFIDADYTYPATNLDDMINILDLNPNIGMILGDRFSKSEKFGSEKNRFFAGNKLLAFIHNMFNGVKLNDPLTGLRVIRSELIRWWKPKSIGFDIEVELNCHIARSGYNIVEIPIKYRPRLGKKKLGFRHGIEIFERILTDFSEDF
ncbi:MAG: glycosyltransferase family 2 protein [Candidatus Bathyarchaeota archaeon]